LLSSTGFCWHANRISSVRANAFLMVLGYHLNIHPTGLKSLHYFGHF
jgi:hypothetical protein